MRRNFKTVFACITAALLIQTGALSQSANAQTVDALTASELETILENAGLGPDMRTDSSTGAPVALGQVGENQFIMRAMNCSGIPKACSELMFFANFKLGRALSVADLLAVNNFNESQVFGRAYVLRSSGENGEVGVDYVIELDGGVSREHIAANIARWADVIAAFIDNMTNNAGS